MPGDELLLEIADLLDAGELVYLNTQTFEILSHPDPVRWDDSEYAHLIQEVKDKVALEPENYIAIDPPDARDSYRIMEDFAFSITDERLRDRLLEALNSKKPFRYFRATVEDSPLLDDWYDFKDARMKEWLVEQLARVWE